jgi:metal-responsive CopG/Arc/MetJ family transcriptional regulator
MITLQVKVTNDLDEQIKRYDGLKKVNKSQAVRELIESGIDVTANESEILKEIKSLRADVRDNHAFNKKGFDRVASLSVKNGKKVFSLFHLVLIQIFFRTKDKGMTDEESLKSRNESMSTATKLGIEEFNKREN